MPGTALAQEAPEVQAVLDNIWVFIAGCLVFFMQAGFALVEAGLTRAKNVVNIFAKNMADAIIGILAFFATGYALAFSSGNDFFGTDGGSFFMNDLDINALGGSGVINLSHGTFFFFQAVFAATAVTICSGAMAERTKFVSYLIFGVVMCAVIYPVVVHMTWGGGFIANISIGDAVYSDFAGSGVVHMTGGVAALVGAFLVGPRKGKFAEDGTPRAIPGHNVPFAIVGVFILWLGWFGFNPGSELAADNLVTGIALNTILAAAAGGLATTVLIWVKTGKPDIAFIGNGVLAGLVAITGPCGTATPIMSIVIGAVGGIIVVFAVLFFDKIKIDDPVGAISVHGVVGIWGVLSIGIFAKYDDAFLGRDDAGLIYGGGFEQLAVQFLMVLTIIVWVGVASFAVFSALKATLGLRVSEEEEIGGLDIPEHGMAGYTADATA
ncbi:ammonium transporter [Ilumatobacter coccineus]|uniref:Ammonium transporter n=1 Tax=Ilumatobacter coccineus (strain NBRC 103263 / KCTC 29153 / YM16-304) TaxID=1313172 RepID=A0A6C7E846_ILUCY|nr:ammonium transporter [Ilumatobacter coccineus]BAN01325.1 ammonium transporter [Ilumatobacter coccineus YM16-304]